MVVKLSEIGKAVIATEYAVRGPIVARAQELERSGREIVYCNIGNPQALKQKPLTYIRQVLSLVEYPELANSAAHLFPADIVETAKYIMHESKFGMGAYSESKGMHFVRMAVANFISSRDGINADSNAIYLTDGASKGVQTILRILIADENDGIMIPIPQYPLYSATLTLYGARQIEYLIDEEHGWQLNQEMLEKSIVQAKSQGIRVRAICVINPGNPTGSVLNKNNIEMVIKFAQKHNLAILADEVYQENIYKNTDSFISFAKVLTELNINDVSLFSFHSCSKGFLGECGHRGGFFEYRNVPNDVAEQITKLQSISLCSNLPGQTVTYLMVNPPKVGSPSFELYMQEKNGILSELKKRAEIVATGLNKVDGITCNEVTGAMYAFPKITIPEGITDSEYCLALLESKGICVVPGSGFGQMPKTAHFRMTILPPTDKIKQVVESIADFHTSFCKK